MLFRSVSHDRFFIQKLAAKTMRLSPDGLFECDADEAVLPERKAAPQKQAKEPNEYHRKKEEAARRRRLTTALTRCEDEIAQLEAALPQLQTEMEACADDYEAILRLTEELHEAEQQLEEQMTLWEELSAEQAELENSRGTM